MNKKSTEKRSFLGWFSNTTTFLMSGVALFIGFLIGMAGGGASSDEDDDDQY